MAGENLSDFLRRLSRQMTAESLADESDRRLVERALGSSDGAAFEAIMRRHGAMVYRVCRRVLQKPEDAEDAFQATFLILAQKLTSVRKHTSLASWLHGIAHRVSVRAKNQAATRRRRESLAPIANAMPSDDILWKDVRSILDVELNRLPDKWRLPLILCYLEGRTQDEAANQLGWSKSTLRRRLTKARATLRQRLTGRGIVWSAALWAVLVSDIGSAAPARKLIAATVDAAAGIVSGKSVTGVASATVAALTEGVLKTMFLAKFTSAMVTLVVTMFAGGGLWALAQPGNSPPLNEKPPVQIAAQEPKPPENKDRQEHDAIRRELTRKAAAKSVDNLQQLMLAMHTHWDVTGTLPPAAVLDKNNKPLLSWRVLLLKHLGERDLFKEFKLNEPWDSTHNRKLLPRMPKIYAPPGRKGAEPNSTFYQVFAGPGTPFEGPRGLSLYEITDGLAQTIVIVEAGNAVPWTKPVDLNYVANKPLPPLGGLFEDRIHCALGDGAVYAAKRHFPEKTMRAMIGRNDMLPIKYDDIFEKSLLPGKR